MKVMEIGEVTSTFLHASATLEPNKSHDVKYTITIG